MLTTVLALGAAVASVRCGARGLRTSEETLAVAAVVLVVIGDRANTGEESALVLAVLAGVYWLIGRLARRAVTWPVAAWLCAQLAVLTQLTGDRAQRPPAGAGAAGRRRSPGSWSRCGPAGRWRWSRW